MTTSPSLRRRSLLGLIAASGLPAVRAASSPVFAVQTEPSLSHGMALLDAALQAAGFAANLTPAPKTSEVRNLHETTSGRIHITLLPPTPTRLSMVSEGRLRMIAVPLERGLLGWRVPFILRDQRGKTAGIRNLQGLQSLVIGQGSGWIDAQIYRKAGIVTRELQAWRNGEFARQMQSGLIDIFPMGLEESISYFLAHFRQQHPELALDEHLLLRYPWYRFVWVSPDPSADDLYRALQQGFDIISSNGRFESVWETYRRALPAANWAGSTVITLDNPLYGRDIVPLRYQHLLLDPSIA